MEFTTWCLSFGWSCTVLHFDSFYMCSGEEPQFVNVLWWQYVTSSPFCNKIQPINQLGVWNWRQLSFAGAMSTIFMVGHTFLPCTIHRSSATILYIYIKCWLYRSIFKIKDQLISSDLLFLNSWFILFLDIIGELIFTEFKIYWCVFQTKKKKKKSVKNNCTS